MARARGKLQRFNFSKGWNTEANPMTFPENTAQDLENVVLDIDGSIRRRLGVSVENAQQTVYLNDTEATYATTAIGFGKWENVAGSGDLNFLISQVGTQLHISIEDGTVVDTVDFSSTIISGKAVEAGKAVLEFASGLGYLFCTGPYTEPFYLEYSGGAVTLTTFAIEIRDFEGVDDGLDVDERPTTLSNLHLYNLRNQGWVDSFDCAVNGGSDATTDPVNFTNTHLGAYPSNADILYLGKAGSGTDEDDIGRYDPKTMAKNAFGTTPAPKGKYILNAFDQDRDAIVAGATSLTINNRPRAVAFHNGRAFFAGVNAVGQSGNVYYSQQLTSIDYVGRCYQQNDPTAEEFNELLATDGGLLKIPDCGNILRLEEGPQGIVVFASNGVWEISGENGRFAADNLFVRKVTDLGCISGESVIRADNTFFYFSEAGIVGSQQDQVTGNLNLDVITTNSIQTGYMLLGGPQRRSARGAYMRADKKCVWLYSTDSTYDSVNDRFKYNGVLILDMRLGAFYKYIISDTDKDYGSAPYVSGIVESDSFVSTEVQEEVTVNGVVVTENGVDVTVGVAASSADVDSTKSTFLLQTVYPKWDSTTDVGIAYATFSSKKFVDWLLFNGEGGYYDSFLETGHELGGESMLDKQPKYVHTYMSRVSKHNETGNFYNITDPTSTTGYRVLYDYNTVCATSPNLNTLYTPATLNISGLTIAADGSKLYVGHRTNTTLGTDINTLVQYDMPTAWDITSIVDDTGSLLLNSQAVNFQMSQNGTKLYTSPDRSTSSAVDQYTLSTPYDITTASLDGSYSLGGAINEYDGTAFEPRSPWYGSIVLGQNDTDIISFRENLLHGWGGGASQHALGTPSNPAHTYSGHGYVHHTFTGLDLNTAQLTSDEFSTRGRLLNDTDTFGRNIYIMDGAFNSDGTVLLTAYWDATTAKFWLEEFKLASAYNISTLINSARDRIDIDTLAGAGYGIGVAYGEDDSSIYVANANTVKKICAS